MHWIENGTFGQSPARGSYLGKIISAEREHSKMLDLVSQFLPSFIYLIQSSGFLLDRSLSLVFPDSFCPLSIKNPILVLSEYIVTPLWQIENIGVIKLQLACIKYHWMTSMALMIYMNNFTDLITAGRRCMVYIISFSQRRNWHWETFRNFLKLFMDSHFPQELSTFGASFRGCWYQNSKQSSSDHYPRDSTGRVKQQWFQLEGLKEQRGDRCSDSHAWYNQAASKMINSVLFPRWEVGLHGVTPGSWLWDIGQHCSQAIPWRPPSLWHFENSFKYPNMTQFPSFNTGHSCLEFKQ